MGYEPLVLEGKCHGKQREAFEAWSIGVIAYLLLSGKHPFTGKTVEQAGGVPEGRR